MANPEFYELDSNGSEMIPGPIKSRTWITVAIITVIILAIALSAILLVNRAANNRAIVTRADSEINTQATIENCLEAGGSESDCNAGALTQAAKDSGDADLCKDIQSGSFANCIELIAVGEKNLKVCKHLEDEARAQCRNRVHFEIAVSNNDQGQCEDIEDVSLLMACNNQFITFETALSDEELILLSFEECNSLADGCIELFRALDSDDDGLSDYEEEAEHKTDRFNADTDGDGFSDGEEVQNGFDPLQ